MTKDVSIILVNYNSADLIRTCLKSVYEKTQDIDFDIWVVDNASKDNSCEIIKQEFEQVNIIKNPENLGFGRANNMAIEQCDSKYVFLLNTDTYLRNNAIKILFDFMEQNQNAGACGGNLYDGNLAHTTSYFCAPTLQDKIVKTFKLSAFFPQIKARLLEKGYNENDEQKEVEVISGADLMIRKSVLNEVGDFDKDFFLYFEETELQTRIRRAGHKIFIVPDSQICHLEGATTTKNRKRRRYEILKSEYLYFKKTNPQKSVFLIKLLCMFSHLVRLFATPVMILKVWKFILEN